MELLLTATNRPEVGHGLLPVSKTVRFDEKERKWISEGKRGVKQVTMHPVLIGQGVC